MAHKNILTYASNPSHTLPPDIVRVTVIHQVFVFILVVVQIEHVFWVALPTVVVVHQRLRYIRLLDPCLQRV